MLICLTCGYVPRTSVTYLTLYKFLNDFTKSGRISAEPQRVDLLRGQKGEL